ncbi:MAG: OmpH family outer membrane protein [bacterium]
MEKINLKFLATLLFASLLFLSAPLSAQLKIGYIDSNKILASYKNAQDVRKQLEDLSKKWQEHAKGLEKEIKEMQEQLESQSLILSKEKKAEKAQQIQNSYVSYQQFLNEKFGPQGEAVKKESELLKPVIEKINEAIKKIGKDEGYNYIFDVVAANILYASEDQTDLTDRLLEELNKGAPAKSN